MKSSHAGLREKENRVIIWLLHALKMNTFVDLEFTLPSKLKEDEIIS